MPRGQNPNSQANLIKPSKDLTASEQRKRASKAGKKSAEVRRAQATLTETLKSKLDDDSLEKITAMLIKKAEMGNLKAYELLRDQIGEKPTEKVAISTVNEESISKLQKAISKRRSNE